MTSRGSYQVEEEMEVLRTQIARLTDLVLTQQQEMKRQEQEIESLKESSTLGKKNISPFECQGIGFGDRRLFGGYDARFHSIHK